ncbi:hypothetical protein BJY52DRAFT_1208109 [Lactarius psammicola]|nr:hypothetical protein BJY52DRAFT_1208109 [Lactarius psammicola]
MKAMVFAEEKMKTELKCWDAPVYAFFKPIPSIQYINNCKAHVFECAASPCHHKTQFMCWFLYTGDSSSTSNLCRHSKLCWGDKALAAADEVCDVKTAFGTGQVTYSHHQHTKIKAWAEFVCWVTESKCPFQIVNDHAFCCLMKTGRPECYIPSVDTLARDVKNVFINVCERIANLLQEMDSKLSFATNAWMSPNHKAYVAITVHFKKNGTPMALLLDLIEVPKSHTGVWDPRKGEYL